MHTAWKFRTGQSFPKLLPSKQLIQVDEFDYVEAETESNAQLKSKRRVIRKIFKKASESLPAPKLFQKARRFELFMSLPRDIRNMIYEQVIFSHVGGFTQHLEILNMYNKQVRREAAEVYLLKTKYFKVNLFTRKAFLNRVGILLVSDPFGFVSGLEIDTFHFLLPWEQSLSANLQLLGRLWNLRRLEITLHSSLMLRNNVLMMDGREGNVPDHELVLNTYHLRLLLKLNHLENVRITGVLPWNTVAAHNGYWNGCSFVMRGVWKAAQLLRELFRQQGQNVIFERRYRWGDHVPETLTRYELL